MHILALDTSTQVATAAVARDGEILGEYMLNHKRTHSQKMLPIIQRLLEDLELDIADMDAFAVGTGPGSFTGLRIGVAMAKGFAQALNRPVIGVSTLELLAANHMQFDGLVVPLMFARVDEVFAGAYLGGRAVAADSVETIGAVLDRLERGTQRLLFTGDGARRHRALIEERLGPRACFAEASNDYHRAASLACVAYRRAQAGQMDDWATLAPVYLRPSQAEREFG